MEVMGMKKAMLMLFAMAFVVCTAVAEFDGMADSSEKKAIYDRWDEGKCCEDGYEHHSPCTEICPGSKPSDRCGCDHGNMMDACDSHPQMPHTNCYVFEKCKECGKARCDGHCNQCKDKCDVYEYCSGCGAKYACEHADGYCDRCGKDCYCIEKCEKCGHNHYYNGYCDDCADRCYYARCCHDSYEGNPHECYGECKDCDPFWAKLPENCEKCVEKERYTDAMPTTFTIYLGEEGSDDVAPEVQEVYPDMESVNPEMQDRYTDQMPSNDPLAAETQVAQAS
jgi:hypothetical protein